MTVLLIVLSLMVAFVAALAYRAVRVEGASVTSDSPRRSVTLKATERPESDDTLLDQPA